MGNSNDPRNPSASAVATVAQPRPQMNPAAAATQRNAAADPLVTTQVDQNRVQLTIDAMRDELLSELSDALGQGKEQLQTFVDYALPRMARLAVLSQSDDQNVATLAKRQLRHLNVQLIADAGTYGVQLQQRFEQRVVGVLNFVLGIAIGALRRV